MDVTTVTIAKLAKTTHATVSRALRDDPSISLKTRRRIKKIADELGYRPNLLARGLVKGKTNTIGFLMGSYHLETASAKVVVLDELAASNGYRVFVAYTKGELKKTKEAADELIDRGVDGLLIYGGFGGGLSHEQIRETLKFRIPVVFFDMEHRFPSRQVVQDRAKGIELAVKYLHSLGHKEIYMLFAYWKGCEGNSRFKGFVNAINNLGCEDARSRIRHVTYINTIDENGKSFYDHNDMRSNIKIFLKEHPECTAVICSNDIVAMEVINTAIDIGLNVPNDLSVIGFDDIVAAEHTRPPLTTIVQPVRKIVSAAWDMLLDSIENGNNEPEKIIISPELKIRESTAKAKQ